MDLQHLKQLMKSEIIIQMKIRALDKKREQLQQKLREIRKQQKGL